jgi:hypothetical protein
MPPPPPETVATADPQHADDPVSRQLDADAASGIKDVDSPLRRAIKAGLQGDYFGTSAQTSVVTFGNGSRWIRKRGLDEDEMDREVLVSKISDVLGAGAPQVTLRDVPGSDLKPHGHMGRITRGPDREMWEPLVPNAEPAIAWVRARGGMDDAGNAERPEDAESDMIDSRQGIKIGILDSITDNGDRHEGNWMVQHGPAGKTTPVPIDHGHAEMDDSTVPDYGGIGPFGERLFGNGAESEQLAAIPKEAWDKWTAGVAALEPQFEAADMAPEFSHVQDALVGAALMSAKGKVDAVHYTGKPLIPDPPNFWTGGPHA